MKVEVSREEVELLLRVVTILYDWSGATDDTPDDCGVISTCATGGQFGEVTTGDLKDASAILTKIKNVVDI
jgi:hypothetical protein